MTRFDFIPSGDERLAASIDFPADAEPADARPVVIVTHGLTGQRIGRSYHLVEFGRRLAERGIVCVRYDQAGCGESTGEFQDLSAKTMVRDAIAVRRWAARQPWADADRIGYTGLSLGALSTVAADAEHPGRAVALWAGVYDLPRAFGAVTGTGMKALMAHQGWVPYRGLRIGAGFIENLAAVDTTSLLARSDAPVMVCHSDDDDVVAVQHGRDYVARCEQVGRPVRFERFTRAGHDFAEYPDRQRLMELNLGFFTQRLLGVEG